jgi:hypothetical protein
MNKREQEILKYFNKCLQSINVSEYLPKHDNYCLNSFSAGADHARPLSPDNAPAADAHAGAFWGKRLQHRG